MTERQEEVLKIVLQECFWGDYHIDFETAKNKFKKNNPDFDRLLFSRIISDSPFPERKTTNHDGHNQGVRSRRKETYTCTGGHIQRALGG